MGSTWHWFLDFIGVNNGEDRFSTHMYNFWSGFGGNISVLALGGALVGIYRHNLRRIARLNPIHRRRINARSETTAAQDELDTLSEDES